MKITRTRSYKINMGNYESLELSGTISIDAADIWEEDDIAGMDPDEVVAGLKEHAVRYLDQLLADELLDAKETSVAEDSMLFDPAPPPRRTERARSRR